jgi:hypothetical protein
MANPMLHTAYMRMFEVSKLNKSTFCLPHIAALFWGSIETQWHGPGSQTSGGHVDDQSWKLRVKSCEKNGAQWRAMKCHERHPTAYIIYIIMYYV